MSRSRRPTRPPLAVDLTRPRGYPVELPVPPSANHLWRSVRSGRGGKVRVIAAENYRRWLGVAVPLLRLTAPAVRGRVAVLVAIVGGSGFKVSRDLDNCNKGVLDALRHAGVIDGDDVRVVRRVVAEYRDGAGGPARCEVTVTPWAGGGG